MKKYNILMFVLFCIGMASCVYGCYSNRQADKLIAEVDALIESATAASYETPVSESYSSSKSDETQTDEQIITEEETPLIFDSESVTERIEDEEWNQSDDSCIFTGVGDSNSSDNGGTGVVYMGDNSVSSEIDEQTTGNPYGFTDDEIWEIARITYLEDGCISSYYTTYLTACVIINRYLDWGYSSIYDVIFDAGQYATAYKYDNWGGGALTINEMTWQAVHDALADTDRNPHFQAGDGWLDGYGLEMYYKDPENGESFYY